MKETANVDGDGRRKPLSNGQFVIFDALGR